jgi:putative ABC transport system ATP-binding protein
MRSEKHGGGGNLLPDGSRSAAGFVHFRNVRKRYSEGAGETVVFRSLEGTFRKGEITALLGRSGSGKSTLLNLVSGIDLPDEGEVSVDGTCVNRLSERDRTLFRRERIGFVFQSYNLIPTLTVEENLLLPLELAGKLGDAGREGARRLLAEVGLAARARSYPDRLSGGEQQRVAVARALVHEPLLLLADEPTGSLDVESGGQVLDLMERMAGRAGRTVILVTHSAEVARIADRVVLLREGRFVPGGTVSESDP